MMGVFVPKNEDEQCLNEFLNMPLSSTKEIMNKFLTLPNSKFFQGKQEGQSFVFVQKDDALITIVAHADTVFNSNEKLEILNENGKIFSSNATVGIGADDRAGCAICWLLKDEPVNILITSGEEVGAVGSYYLKTNHPNILKTISKSKCVLQFDRKNGNEFRTYNIKVTEKFKEQIKTYFNFVEAFGGSGTDIVNLCQNVDGANLSIGYYNQHTPNEYLVLSEWQSTLNKTRTFLEMLKNT